jgi:hypothetical protein
MKGCGKEIPKEERNDIGCLVNMESRRQLISEMTRPMRRKASTDQSALEEGILEGPGKRLFEHCAQIPTAMESDRRLTQAAKK